MILTQLRFSALILAALLLLPPSSTGFETPLTDTAVRDAYFLGQRRDEDLARFLEKYARHLPQPKTGPYVQSVSFLTPYAITAQYSSLQPNIYSAQQAQLDHNKQPEFVRMVVQISLTDSYGPYLMSPTNNRYASPQGIGLRPSNFWKDLRFRVYDGDKFTIPTNAQGNATYRCDDEGGCILTGAVVSFEYSADAFTSDTATVQIDPPEGDQVVVDFDLTSFR